jgi:hypothetical protein
VGACNRRADHSPWRKGSAKCRAYPGPPYRRRLWGSGPATHAKRFGMGGRSTYASVSSHIELKGPYSARRRADIWLESVHQKEIMYGILCKPFGSRRPHFDDPCPRLRHPSMVPNSRCSVLKCSAFRQARFQSTNFHFYQNRQLELYAAKEAQRLSLRQLVHDLC